MPVAEGGNYALVIDRTIAWARVWKRPDLDSEAGARLAVELAQVFLRVTQEPFARVCGAVLDLREAPPVIGPSTRATIGRVAAAWELIGRRFAFLAGDNATQRLQLAAVVADHAPRLGAVCSNHEDAEAWIRRGELPPPSSRKPTRR